MAQLSDDCFAFGGALLGVDAALALIEERVTPVVEEEVVPLAQACGAHATGYSVGPLSGRRENPQNNSGKRISM